LFHDALQGIDVDLPNLEPILPFVGLYTLVALSPQKLKGYDIPAHHLPEPLILDGDQFISVPVDTSPDPSTVVRIFDVSIISDELPKTYYSIPLSPEHTGFTQQRYWRVPAKPEVILMMLMERIRRVTESNCEEINHARVIYCILHLHKAGVHDIGPRLSRKRLSEKDSDESSSKLTRAIEPPAKKSRYRLRERTPSKTITNPRPCPRPRKKLRIKI
jgi:hypothetical protein